MPVISNPRMAPQELASSIVQRTVQFYTRPGMNYDNITQSAVDTSHLDNVVKAVSQMAQLLSTIITDNGNAIAASRDNTQAYAEYTYKDLWDYTEQLRARLPSLQALTNAIDEVQMALSKAVIAEAHSINRRVRRSHGLSIYIPRPSEFDTRYSLLAFARSTFWDEWLQVQPQ